MRLIGVNAPEKGECFSEESFLYLVETIDEREVGMEIVRTDQFDRALGNVWLDDELINLTLVESGLAIAQTPDEGNPFGDQLIAAEDAAYLSGVGLWAAGACGSDQNLPDVRIALEDAGVDPPGPDDDHLDDEHITIVSEEEETVDLSGWTLRDESSQNRLVFGPGTAIAPGEELVIVTGCSSRPGWCGDTPIWNNDGDMALLLDENGAVVARRRY